jgi:ribosomal protein S18 acetylase RimI-like enzyme
LGDDVRMQNATRTIRRAGADDAGEVARLVHAFNTEYFDPVPPQDVLAARFARLLAQGEMYSLLAGKPPHGLAIFRLRPALTTEGLDAYLEELYIAPGVRGQGGGRALMEAAMEYARELGARRMDLGTSEDDTAALGLYASLGFTNREGRPDGPVMLYLERDL